MASKEQIGRKCPYCGAMFTYDEYFCRACHRKFTDQNELDAPSSHKPEIYVVGLPKTGITLVLSFIGVGLGQFYNGDTIKGILFFQGICQNNNRNILHHWIGTNCLEQFQAV